MFFQLRIFFHLPKLLVKTCELKAFPTIHGLTRLAPKSFLRNLLENVLRPKEGESQDPGKRGTWTTGDLTKEGGSKMSGRHLHPGHRRQGAPTGARQTALVEAASRCHEQKACVSRFTRRRSRRLMGKRDLNRG